MLDIFGFRGSEFDFGAALDGFLKVAGHDEGFEGGSAARAVIGMRWGGAEDVAG